MSSSSARLTQNSCSSGAFGRISICLVFVPTSAHPSFEIAVSTRSPLFRVSEGVTYGNAVESMSHNGTLKRQKMVLLLPHYSKIAVDLKLFTVVFEGFSMVAVSLVHLTCFSPLTSGSRKFCACWSHFNRAACCHRTWKQCTTGPDVYYR